MSAKHPEKDVTKGANVKGDDLSLIRGIGPARRQWLSDTFQIETIADLAASSADEIYIRLKEEQIVARSKIESWIEQAKAMVESGNHQANLKVQEQGWKPFASFVIEFQEEVATGQCQTKAHHIEADKTIKWSGVEQEVLCHWIIEQLGSKVQSSPVTDLAAHLAQPIQPQFSEKLQSILVKSGGISTGQPSQPVVKSPPTATTVGNQDRLKVVIAKAQQLAAAAIPTTASSQPADQSDRLKQILARKQKLMSKTD